MSDPNEKPKIVPAMWSVAHVLRQFTAGAVFVMTYHYANGDLRATNFSKGLQESGWVTLAAVVMSGILIYSMHRAIFNPWIELGRQWFVRKFGASGFVTKFVYPREVIDRMLARWNFLSLVKPYHSHITDWGDYIHLQYTAVLAIIGGCIAARMTSEPADWDADGSLIVLALLALFGGLFSDLRKHLVETELYENWPQNRKDREENAAKARARKPMEHQVKDAKLRLELLDLQMKTRELEKKLAQTP